MWSLTVTAHALLLVCLSRALVPVYSPPHSHHLGALKPIALICTSEKPDPPAEGRGPYIANGLQFYLCPLDGTESTRVPSLPGANWEGYLVDNAMNILQKYILTIISDVDVLSTAIAISRTL